MTMINKKNEVRRGGKVDQERFEIEVSRKCNRKKE